MQRFAAGRSRHLSTEAGGRSKRNSLPNQSSLYGSIALAGISAIALAVYARDPLLTEAGREREERKKTKYIRLKDIKSHGADSEDGVWVSRGVSSLPRLL